MNAQTINPPAPWPSVGVHFGLSHDEYFRPSEFRGKRIFSKSLGGQFAPDPAIWKALDDLGKADVESDSISWGTLVDLLAFRPYDFEKGYAVTPATYTSAKGKTCITTEFPGEWNGRTKACSEWKKAREAEGFTVLTPKEAEEAATPKPWNWASNTCQAWREELRRDRPNCQIVSDADLVDARAAVAVLQADERYRELAAGASFQVAMLAMYGGIPIRGALDILPAADGPFGDALADLKTCSRMGSVRELERHILDYKYHVQAWLYLSLWNALNPKHKRDRFVFVFQSSSAPFEVVRLEMSRKSIELGGKTFKEWVTKWKQCVETDVWPSKWDGIDFISLPAFAFRAEEAEAFTY